MKSLKENKVMAIKINDALTVRACPESVVIESADLCDASGATHHAALFLLLSKEESIAFASAVLQTALNLPEHDFSDVPAEYK